MPLRKTSVLQKRRKELSVWADLIGGEKPCAAKKEAAVFEENCVVSTLGEGLGRQAFPSKKGEFLRTRGGEKERKKERKAIRFAREGTRGKGENSPRKKNDEGRDGSGIHLEEKTEKRSL